MASPASLTDHAVLELIDADATGSIEEAQSVLVIAAKTTIWRQNTRSLDQVRNATR
jgi:hypothetical protein